MNLNKWLNRIEQLHPIKWDLGLERVGVVARRLDVIKPAKTTFLVAGTNGKGSTCEYLDALCRSHGLSTGKTTSPHLLRYNERIVTNGKMAADEEIVAAFEEIDDQRAEISLSYFEFSALAALLIFKQRQVDVAIMEIGLGGRLDAMNVVEADVCVITQIAMDHESWLGDSLEKIAREKAGIMRQGKYCVIADHSPPQSLRQQALETQCIPQFIGDDFGLESDNFWYQNPRGMRATLAHSGPGHLPPNSAAAALQAFSDAGFNVEPSHFETVMSETRLDGRMQWRQPHSCSSIPEKASGHQILLDVAHNPNAAAYLRDFLRNHLQETLQEKRQTDTEGGRVHAIVGMYADKDIEAVFAMMQSQVSNWYLTNLDDERAACANQLKSCLTVGAGCPVSTYDKVSAAYHSALAAAERGDLILVFGSFLVVAGVMVLTEDVPVLMEKVK